MKIKKLNEGLRVNPEILEMSGTYTINEVLDELEVLKVELKNWRRGGWKSIQGFGSEWIPLSE